MVLGAQLHGWAVVQAPVPVTEPQAACRWGCATRRICWPLDSLYLLCPQGDRADTEPGQALSPLWDNYVYVLDDGVLRQPAHF